MIIFPSIKTRQPFMNREGKYFKTWKICHPFYNCLLRAPDIQVVKLLHEEWMMGEIPFFFNEKMNHICFGVCLIMNTLSRISFIWFHPYVFCFKVECMFVRIKLLRPRFRGISFSSTMKERIGCVCWYWVVLKSTALSSLGESTKQI